MFHDGRNHCFQGHGCQASSEDPLGLELIACVATSCSKQPHAEGQKVRRAHSQIDRAVKARVSREARCCYSRVWLTCWISAENTWDAVAAAEIALLHKRGRARRLIRWQYMCKIMCLDNIWCWTWSTATAKNDSCWGVANHITGFNANYVDTDSICFQKGLHQTAVAVTLLLITMKHFELSKWRNI